jgi:hypothetical protein
MISPEFKNLMGAKVAAIVKWNRSLGITTPTNHAFISVPGNNPAKTERVGFLARAGTEPNSSARPILDCCPVTWTRS